MENLGAIPIFISFWFPVAWVGSAGDNWLVLEMARYSRYLYRSGKTKILTLPQDSYVGRYDSI